MMITPYKEHWVDILIGASQVGMMIEEKIQDPTLKLRWHTKIADAIQVLFSGVEYRKEESYWFFESRPGSTRTKEEKKGHTISSTFDGNGREKIECSCEAGTHKSLCWARAARAILVELERNGRQYELSEELFEEEDVK